MKRINNTSIKIWCLLGLTSVALSGQAQENKETNLNREMTIEREYDPSVQDANKVNTLPEVKEPEVRKIPIDYASFQLPISPSKEVSLLPSGSAMTKLDYNKKRGYLNFGAGNYLNINGDVGYHILATERDQMNLYFTHRSTNGKVEYLQLQEKVKAKINDNLGGLNYRHQFDKAAFKIGARYGYSGFNYYGLPLTLSGNPITQEEFAEYGDRETNQAAQTIHAYTGVASNPGAAFGYSLDVDYTNFSYKYGWVKEFDGATEHTIGGRLDLNGALGDAGRIGLAAGVKSFSYNLPELPYRDGATPYIPYSFENYAEISASPYFLTGGRNWSVKLGVNLIYITGDDSQFMATPNVGVQVGLGAKTTFYASATGQVQSNSMHDVAQMNRYVNPTQGIAPTQHWLNSVIGIKSGVIPGFWFDIFGGYNIMKDDLLFVPMTPSSHKSAFANMSESLGFVDFNHLFVGASLKFSYRKYVDIYLKGQYNHADISRDDAPDQDQSWAEIPPYGRPKIEIGAGVTVRPISPLSLSLDYAFAKDRCTLLNRKEIVPLDNINDLNFTAQYAFNDTFGLYVKLNNILMTEYDIYYGYPAQRFNMMAGININF
ncbi:TonB-dependent receptor [Parabacteroides sp. OttesenSCG-928-N08]|nr:TonB-dependent receptor [Parabacteroides sp. OttesenSCG-928-N08]